MGVGGAGDAARGRPAEAGPARGADDVGGAATRGGRSSGAGGCSEPVLGGARAGPVANGGRGRTGGGGGRRAHPPGGGQPSRAERHDRLRLVAGGDLRRADVFSDQLDDERDARRSAHQVHRGEVGGSQARGGDGVGEHLDGVLDVVDDHRLELAAVDEDLDVCRRHEHLGRRVRRERFLRPSGLAAQFERGMAPGALVAAAQLFPHVGSSFGEMLAEPTEQQVVEALAADRVVATGHADDLEPVTRALQHGGVEGASAEVVDGHVTAGGHIGGRGGAGARGDRRAEVVHRRGHGLVDEGHLAEAGATCGIDQRCPSGVGPSHRMGEHCGGGLAAVGPQRSLGDERCEHGGGSRSCVDGGAAEQQGCGEAECCLGRAFDPIGMRPGQLLGGGADDELPVGRQHHGRRKPSVAVDLERRHPPPARPAAGLGRRDADGIGRPG